MEKFSIKTEIKNNASLTKETVTGRRKKVLITGATSQIGKEFIELVAKNWLPDHLLEHYDNTQSDSARISIPELEPFYKDLDLGTYHDTIREFFNSTTDSVVDDNSAPLTLFHTIYDVVYLSYVSGLDKHSHLNSIPGFSGIHNIKEQFNFIHYDLSDPTLYDILIKDIAPDVIINLAAVTNLQKVTPDNTDAYLVNVEAVKTMVKYCKNFNKKMIHISSDMIFNDYTPGSEHMFDNHEVLNNIPCNTMGIHKLLSELAMQDITPRSFSASTEANGSGLVIRVSNLYSKYKSNIVKSLTTVMTNNNTIQGISDNRFVPTAASNVAKHIYYLLMMDLPEWSMGGTIQLVDSVEPISTYDLSLYLATKFDKIIHVDKVSLSEYTKSRSLPQELPYNTAMHHTVVPFDEPALTKYFNYDIYDNFVRTIDKVVEDVLFEDSLRDEDVELKKDEG